MFDSGSISVLFINPTRASPNAVKGIDRGNSEVQQEIVAYSWSAIESQIDGR